jgi:hypothetical protein
MAPKKKPLKERIEAKTDRNHRSFLGRAIACLAAAAGLRSVSKSLPAPAPLRPPPATLMSMQKNMWMNVDQAVVRAARERLRRWVDPAAILVRQEKEDRCSASMEKAKPS